MMMGTESNGLSKNGIDERDEVIRKYEAVIESLQQDLKECKIEQTRIRMEINSVILENKNTTNIANDAFHHMNSNECHGSAENRECVENLQRQIAVIQLQKDSTFQLWQMALKAINALEQELKETHNDERKTKYYEDQLDNVKETYSEAIKALESKLSQAKENFERQQILWQSTSEKMNSDKAELEHKLLDVQSEMLLKNETNRKTTEKLKSDLNITKQELETLNISKIKLEKELAEMRYFTTRIVAKDDESKEKVAEAIELVETAVREREIVLHREAMIIDEKKKLESRLAILSDEFAARLEKELCESKENFEKNTQNYVTEIRELKAELRDKATKMDRIQREYRLIGEELMKARQGTDNYLERSNLKVLGLEQKFKDSQVKLENCEESLRHKFCEKIRDCEDQIRELKERLSNADDRTRQSHVYNAEELDDERRESLGHKMNNTVEGYPNLEKRLIRSLDECESVRNELRSLQIIHDREITRRENERRLLESRIKELQDDIRKANDLADKSIIRADTFERRIESLQKELGEYRDQPIIKQDKVKCSNAEDKSMQSEIIREKYEKKISELTRYVKIHQKLSARWKEEAQSLASKFDDRYKSLRSKINILKKENEVLNHELISWRQQVALCHTQTIQRYDQGDSAR